MEQFHVPYIQYQHRSGPEFYALTYFICPLSFAIYLYLRKSPKNLKILVFIIFFVDDGLFISQSNSFDISNSHLFCSYNILIILLEKFGLVVEHSKTEIFHFNRSQDAFNLPSLDLSPLGGFILRSNNSWKYLRFIFDRKLTFHQHVNFYTNKLISTVKCIKILGNSNYGINPLQKYLLYRICILSIALYEFQL